MNGGRIDGRRPLKALDVIRIGAEEFRYYSATPEPDRPAVPPVGAAVRLSDTLVGLPRSRPLAVLRIKSGDTKGVRHQVTVPVVNLGRADSNEIRITDASVSASHAKLQLREGVWTLTDLGSSNGSVVDDEPVTDETPLSPGATIKLGDVLISFEPNDERIEVRPPGPVLTARPTGRVRSPVNVVLLAVAILVLVATLAALVLLV